MWLLINEVIEAQSYLSGKNINEKNLYRICYILAKWYKEKGQTNKEIRDSIFEWANKNNIYIPYSVNNIIYHALKDNQRLKDNVVVRINENDIKEINSRFDRKNTKLVALAMLCYAKCFADSNKEFSISPIALATWINIDASNMRNIYIKELIDFDYIAKVEHNKNQFSWNKKYNNRLCRYKILVDLKNTGEYQIVDNNIRSLFDEIFK
mgnify:FL=1